MTVHAAGLAVDKPAGRVGCNAAHQRWRLRWRLRWQLCPAAGGSSLHQPTSAAHSLTRRPKLLSTARWPAGPMALMHS